MNTAITSASLAAGQTLSLSGASKSAGWTGTTAYPKIADVAMGIAGSVYGTVDAITGN